MEPDNGIQDLPVIDMWAPIVPSRGIMRHVGANLPDELLSYLAVFSKMRVTAEQYAQAAPALTREDDEILADLDAARIRWSLITGFDEKSTCGKTFVSNEVVAELAARYPDRFIPFAGADVLADGALKEFEHWITERGFRGLSLRPFMIGRPLTDPVCQPFLAACAELGVPVSVHCSHNWTSTRPSDLGHPRHIDEIACRYPELTLIMSHAGYPWVLEACLTAWKHPNVYLELAAHRPRYFTAAGAGWEPLMRFGRSTIADKILYGTGAFLINRPASELVGEMRELPLSPEVARKWLYDNAARLLSLD
ncbi:amidohydrolase [Nocardia sp. 2]|uniref:Amidohydrolase n=1 Tax=Nocardia acididurans TaxID=2802282 RepID=A0ABS1M825_9NOCA|nr:amidohydrolase family protein [Nocardia acididurans]MBL1076741.1 amidohydrolase [Nocardia acididurans]